MLATHIGTAFVQGRLASRRARESDREKKKSDTNWNQRCVQAAKRTRRSGGRQQSERLDALGGAEASMTYMTYSTGAVVQEPGANGTEKQDRRKNENLIITKKRPCGQCRSTISPISLVEKTAGVRGTEWGDGPRKYLEIGGRNEHT